MQRGADIGVGVEYVKACDEAREHVVAREGLWPQHLAVIWQERRIL